MVASPASRPVTYESRLLPIRSDGLLQCHAAGIFVASPTSRPVTFEGRLLPIRTDRLIQCQIS